MPLIKTLARNELAWTGSIRLLTELIDQVGCGASEKTMGKKSNKDKKSRSTPESATRGSGVDGKSKIGNKEYEAELFKLQVELVKLQDWVKARNARIVIIFEGRDAAGKGGMIKRIMERVSPRIFRVVALPAPTERQKTQLHAQRYIAACQSIGGFVLYQSGWFHTVPTGCDRTSSPD
jgi:polyphosphate kinase